MITLANRGKILGQMNPFVSPALDALTPAPAPSAAPAGGGEVPKALLAGTSVMLGGVALASTLFTYGLARDSQSKMVKTSGYIVAAISAIGTLGYLVGGPIAAFMAGDRR